MRLKGRGFTLVEVVVSISILSLIMLALVTAMRSLATTQSRLELRAEQASEVLQVSRFLQQNLSAAVPVTVVQLGVLEGYLFDGSKDQLQWVAPLIIPGIPGGVSVIKLTVEDGQLLAQVRPGASQQAWSEDDPTFVVLQNLNSFDIAYRADVYADWQSSWGQSDDTKHVMPAQVRLRLKVAGRFWPDIIVPLDAGSL